MGITLEYGDSSQRQDYISRRVAIGVAMLVMFLVHFTFQLIAYFSKEENSKVIKKKFEFLSKKLYLLGIAMLISYNYLQAGVFEAVMAWLTLVLGVALHATTLKQFDKPQIEKKLWLGYYFFIFVYFFGLIISFYAS